MGDILIRLYGGLDERVAGEGGELPPGQTMRVAVEGPLPVREVLCRLGLSEKDVHAVFVGKRRVKLEEELREGDTLSVFPPMAGG